MTFHEMKLGRQKSRHDDRTLMAWKYLAKVKPAPPTVLYGAKVKRPALLGNDSIGDCTAAALCHQFTTWTSETEPKPASFTTANAIKLYAAVTGYTPKDPNTDQGAQEIDVLNYVRKNTLHTHQLHAFASVNPRDYNEVKQALWVFGGLYIGLDLPITAQSQAEWDVVPGTAKGDGAPGSWGGHAVHVNGYDHLGLDLETWDVKMRMTWNFFGAYCSEVWALVSPDWLKAGVSPGGLNEKALDKDLAALGKVA